MDTIYCPERRVDLFCGKPLLIFHDYSIALLESFCRFTPQIDRCTRIVINFDYHLDYQNIIYVDNQTEIETAIWYASADAVVTCNYQSNVCMCNTPAFGDIDQLRSFLKI